MLRLEDDWVWDSWIADDGERFHIFYLKAPRALIDPRLRHERATVGHASSTDLVHWEVQRQALGPSPAGWDDLAIWTGSVVRGPSGEWWCFYTALRSAGHGVRDQRIGVALSPDLTNWERVGGRPIVEPDPRWYTTLAEDDDASETWRDPFVFADPGGDGWHMLITARLKGAPQHADGVLATARSADLVNWRVGPPSSNTAGFGQIEVPQVRRMNGRWLLVFTCHPDEQSAGQVERFGRYSTWFVLGDSALGPWDLTLARPFTADPALFAAPLVQRRDGGWVFLGFHNLESEGVLSFEIVDPILVEIKDGHLVEAES